MIKKKCLLAVGLAMALSINPASGLEEKTSGDIRYLSGGIGQEEAQAMREAARRYNLAMTFTIGTGQFVSDVKVVVKNKGGNVVLDTVSDGPMLLANLPPGPYTVEATFEGKTQTRKVTVAQNKHRQLILRWPGSGSA